MIMSESSILELLNGLGHRAMDLTRQRDDLRVEAEPIVDVADQLRQKLTNAETSLLVAQDTLQEWKVLLLTAKLADRGLSWCSQCLRVVESPNFMWVEVIYKGTSHHHESWDGERTEYSLKHLCAACQAAVKEQYKRFYPSEVEVIDGRWGVRCGGTNMWIPAAEACAGRLFNLTATHPQKAFLPQSHIFKELWAEHCSSLLWLDQSVPA